MGQEVACVGRVVAKGVLPTRRGLRIFHAVLRDDSGVLECVWPGQAFLDRSIAVGQTLLVSGPVRFYHGRQMAPREFVILADADDEAEPLAGGKVLPVYPATEGLSHKIIRALVDRHLDALIALSAESCRRRPALARAAGAAGRAARRASSGLALAEAERGRRRLAFDELLDLQLMLSRARALAKRSRSGVAFDDQARAHHEAARVAALAAHRRPAARAARDHRRHDGAGPDAPAAHGRRRHRQDGRRAVRDAARGRERLPGGAHGADRAAGRAARGHARAAARAARLRPSCSWAGRRAAEKQAVRGAARRRAGPARVGTHALVQESVSFRDSASP